MRLRRFENTAPCVIVRQALCILCLLTAPLAQLSAQRTPQHLDFALSRGGATHSSGACITDRGVWTLVGAGLGAAAAAIPATIVHRHDQLSSHRIVWVSVAAGALFGFAAAGHDHSCAAAPDSSPGPDEITLERTSHSRRGALAGAFVGGIVGAVGSSYYDIGCTNGSCSGTRTRVMVLSATEGAIAGALLGTLIGWAWPARGVAHGP